MGRYTGPRTKICRRLGYVVYDNTNISKAYAKREGGRNQEHRKQTEYGRRLVEKQKIKYFYGLREEQMKRFYELARRQDGDTGRNFLAICERRLDNAVYLAGFAPTRQAARQLIAHGHVIVDNKKTDIPSYLVVAGQEITIRDKGSIRKLVKENLDSRKGYESPEWISTDRSELRAKIVRLPIRDDVRLVVTENLVIEFYSK